MALWAATEADPGRGSSKGTISEGAPGSLTGVGAAVSVGFAVETVF